ncbi:MAG: sigma-54 dependent transcriptional regulator [Thermodesulfobacteriota bacterium]
MKSVLVAAKDPKIAEGIGGALNKGYRVTMASDRETCLNLFRRKRFDFAFIDIDFLQAGRTADGRAKFAEALLPFWQALPGANLIVMSRQDRKREAVAAVKAGAGNYLTYPLDPHEVRHVAERLIEFQKFDSELRYFREGAVGPGSQVEAWTNSRLMMEVMDNVASVAPTKTTVLLTGETGTGKSVMAKLIHSRSNRAEGPFIAVHCGAVPESLIESEFFGHEKGAFTGAVRRKLGKFQIADKGTIFLDEVGTISQAAQVKLLQFLQDRTFTPVGGEASLEVDVRVVAASNTDLLKLCHAGSFREDLYYRLNVFPIELPPLRERIEDLPLLVETFLDRLNQDYGKGINGLDPNVLEVLKRYPWPGNIRELENLVERAYILEKEPYLTAESFPGDLFAFEALGGGLASQEVPTLDDVRQRAIEQVEKRYLRELLMLNQGRKDKTAAMARVSTRQLHNLLTKHGLRREDYLPDRSPGSSRR